MAAAAKTVILIGTLDTKGDEYVFARDRFKTAGVKTILIDVGIISSHTISADITNVQVTKAARKKLAELRSKGEIGRAHV